MKKHLEGSLTVEAAFVIPIVVFTVFIIIYYSFYLHDICRMKSIADRWLHRAVMSSNREGDIAKGEIYYESIGSRGILNRLMDNHEEEEEAIGTILQKELGQGLFITSIDNVQVRVANGIIYITFEADFRMSMVQLTEAWKPGSGRILTFSGPIHNPTEFVRMADVIMETGQKVKGAEEIKDKLEEILGLVHG